jgi:glycolate oxidase FAD binding subunit
MNPPIAPTTPEELATVLGEAALQNKSIALIGFDSKLLMAGPAVKTDILLSTRGLGRVLDYEPKDLTISVQAGIPLAELQALLAKNGQMVALDPPHSELASVGGVIASNSSGPLRLGYGTARDLVIGMTFATLQGKLVRTGGMVVKNVAGLDIAKLMIGSFGTLAVVTSVNFRVHSRPARTSTFLFEKPTLESALELRRSILASPLHPIAADLLSPRAMVRLHRRGFAVALRAAGSDAVLARYRAAWNGAEILEHAEEEEFWRFVREFSPDHLRRNPEGCVLRVSSTLKAMGQVLGELTEPYISRLMSGVTTIPVINYAAAAPILARFAENHWPAVIEYAPHSIRAQSPLWLVPENEPEQNAFRMMEKLKAVFDPQHLLNRNRLYGRI